MTDVPHPAVLLGIQAATGDEAGRDAMVGHAADALRAAGYAVWDRPACGLVRDADGRYAAAHLGGDVRDCPLHSGPAPDLVRSTDGRTIHRAGCRRPGARSPWVWARGRTLAEVRAWAAGLNLRACRFCDPLAGNPS